MGSQVRRSVIPHECNAYCRDDRHACVFGVSPLSRGKEAELFATYAAEQGVRLLGFSPAHGFVMPPGWGVVEGMGEDGRAWSDADIQGQALNHEAYAKFLMRWEE